MVITSIALTYGFGCRNSGHF